VTLSAGEPANVLELAVSNFKTDASLFLPSAAEIMLQELEKPPAESKLLTDLFLKLSRVTDVNGNCSTIVSCDADSKTVGDDIFALEIGHSTEKQKPGDNHVCGAREKITKLKQNSRKMVSMFIPPDAPKLSFSEDTVGVYVQYSLFDICVVKYADLYGSDCKTYCCVLHQLSERQRFTQFFLSFCLVAEGPRLYGLAWYCWQEGVPSPLGTRSRNHSSPVSMV